jgi:hypothetical protein
MISKLDRDVGVRFGSVRHRGSSCSVRVRSSFVVGVRCGHEDPGGPDVATAAFGG